MGKGEGLTAFLGAAVSDERAETLTRLMLHDEYPTADSGIIFSAFETDGPKLAADCESPEELVLAIQRHIGFSVLPRDILNLHGWAREEFGRQWKKGEA